MTREQALATCTKAGTVPIIIHTWGAAPDEPSRGRSGLGNYVSGRFTPTVAQGTHANGESKLLLKNHCYITQASGPLLELNKTYEILWADAAQWYAQPVEPPGVVEVIVNKARKGLLGRMRTT